MATSALTFIEENRATSSTDRWIRTIDIVGAAFALVLFAPLLLVVALAVAAGADGPIVFAHRRIGKNGKYFHCLKFRTMVRDAEKKLQAVLDSCPEKRASWLRDQKLKDDPRITRLGRFLRVSSLDELPQLWNVLMGDMSLVGPRPITDAEVPRYGRYFADYAKVKPGITGLWQISGRNDVSYRRRVAMDVAYARSLSVGLFLRILAFTIPAVISARGSS